MNSTAKKIERGLKFHPYRIFTFLTIGGISSAFLTLTTSYFHTTLNTSFIPFKLPAIFHANTIVILASSYSMHQTRMAGEHNHAKDFANGLLITALLGIAFTFFQVIGWMEMIDNGVALQNNVGGAYLYVISGLHLAHLVVGVAILLFYWLNAKERESDPLKELLFDTSPVEKLKIKCLAIYWHFVDGLWMYLYLFFLFTLYMSEHIRG